MNIMHCTPCSFEWSDHALERKAERNIELDPKKVQLNDVLSLPYYTNAGCYHYCDTNVGVTYYVRYDKETKVPEIVTIIKRNPISMARRICEINGWEFNSICRDHLFGNCRRGNSCKYVHKSI